MYVNNNNCVLVSIILQKIKILQNERYQSFSTADFFGKFLFVKLKGPEGGSGLIDEGEEKGEEEVRADQRGHEAIEQNFKEVLRSHHQPE